MNSFFNIDELIQLNLKRIGINVQIKKQVYIMQEK